MRLERSGANRIVLLTRRYAIKVPRAHSVRALLYGLLNNLNEAKTAHLPGRCPVLFSLPFGLAIVMPRADPITDTDMEQAHLLCMEHGIPAEKKLESFGLLNGRLVAIDYGWE